LLSAVVWHAIFVAEIWLYLYSVIVHVFVRVLLAAGTLLGGDSLLVVKDSLLVGWGVGLSSCCVLRLCCWLQARCWARTACWW
jgi:hypothetical protein